tara:strand:+ start:376 stop:1665 length:1290 start_codon:yes stop_codon:yes gene_type:complete
MNEYDSDRILDIANEAGYTPTNNLLETDCYVLNTCHIREKATEKVYDDIGRIKKKFRNQKKPILLVTGCVAQAESDEMIKRSNYIDGVIGPQSYHLLPEIIKKIENKNKINLTEFDTIDKFDKLNTIRNSNSKVSTFLTIQEGCDKFCNFCVVPYTRGPEFSRPIFEILSEAKQLIENGSKEIILLGQNVNAYHYKNYKLSNLIHELNNLKGLERIRFTTSHPKDMTDDLIETYSTCNKLMPSLHLPVQSGSSKILKLMNRKHNINDYLYIIEKLKRKNPLIKFTSDFIIGYPGENQSDFNSTIDLIKKIKFINSYSFIFSSRPGTPASNLKSEQIEILKERLKIFQKESDKIKINYRNHLVNKNSQVLFENKLENQEKYFGRNEYGDPVIVESKTDLTGKILKVKINHFNKNSLFGEIENNNKRDFAA